MFVSAHRITACVRCPFSKFLKVTAIESDPPNRVARMSVEVILVDQNDNSPNFTQGLYVVRVDGEQKEGMLLVWVRVQYPINAVVTLYLYFEQQRSLSN